MLTRRIVDYVGKELLKTSCLGCVKTSSMKSLETSSWVSRKLFLMLIISLNCASNLMCHLRFRYSAHPQDLNNWLNIQGGPHNFSVCFTKSIARRDGSVLKHQIQIPPGRWEIFISKSKSISNLRPKFNHIYYFSINLNRCFVSEKTVAYSPLFFRTGKYIWLKWKGILTFKINANQTCSKHFWVQINAGSIW